MEVTSKWPDGIEWLSSHKDEIACFNCPKCGKSKNYDVNSMLKVLGDISVKSLPDVVSKAAGCLDHAKTGWDRCKMAPAWRAFQKIKWSPEVKIPRGYLELGDTTVGRISEWQILHAKCCCGWLRYVDRGALLRRYGAEARTKDLERRLKCRRCEKRGLAIFIFRQEKR
jgi:transcription elongation factor Elf1